MKKFDKENKKRLEEYLGEKISDKEYLDFLKIKTLYNETFEEHIDDDIEFYEFSKGSDNLYSKATVFADDANDYICNRDHLQGKYEREEQQLLARKCEAKAQRYSGLAITFDDNKSELQKFFRKHFIAFVGFER